MKKPNTHECSFFGRKLSNVSCDDIEVSKGYVCIGSENDDQIYHGDALEEGKQILKERVKIYAIDDDENNPHYFEVDLEDILKFAAKYCNGMYRRVLGENENK